MAEKDILECSFTYDIRPYVSYIQSDIFCRLGVLYGKIQKR